jgi:hypothetical protein
MATVDWPTSPAFRAREITLGVDVPKSAWSGFFTANSQSISHLADRLTLSLELPPCTPQEAGEREAGFLDLVSQGHQVRLWHMARPEPQGTLRGAPTVAAAASAGARQVLVQSVPGATLLAGDLLGVGNQLLPVGPAGAVANGVGLLTVPLSLPLRVSLASGAAVIWQAPRGLFQLVQSSVALTYGRAAWQRAVSLAFREFY